MSVVLFRFLLDVRLLERRRRVTLCDPLAVSVCGVDGFEDDLRARVRDLIGVSSDISWYSSIFTIGNELLTALSGALGDSKGLEVESILNSELRYFGALRVPALALELASESSTGFFVEFVEAIVIGS